MQAGKYSIALGSIESSIRKLPDLGMSHLYSFKKKFLKFYLFLDSNKSAYRLRATINRHLAVNALQRQRWTDFDNLSLNALEDYTKLYDRSKFKRNEVEIILHSGAMFMAFQFKPFEERAIKFEQIIKLCESVKV